MFFFLIALIRKPAFNNVFNYIKFISENRSEFLKFSKKNNPNYTKFDVKIFFTVNRQKVCLEEFIKILKKKEFIKLNIISLLKKFIK